ncbi:MAG: phosphoribosyltransferase [Promethearchaeota archaeon]
MIKVLILLKEYRIANRINDLPNQIIIVDDIITRGETMINIYNLLNQGSMNFIFLSPGRTDNNLYYN